MNAPTQQDTKIWFAISMILIGVIVGFTAGKFTGVPVGNNGGNNNNPPSAQGGNTPPPQPTGPAYADILPVDPKTDHIRGNTNAVVYIIEYSDLQCPYCAKVHPTIKQLVDQYDGKVSWIYRHYPLNFHPFAQKAAEATECASELGGNEKFWAMTDTIYEKGADTNKLADYAEEIGLKRKSFTDCLDSGKFAKKISDQMEGGSKAGIRGTPGNLLINPATKKVTSIPGALPLESFKSAVDALMK